MSDYCKRSMVRKSLKLYEMSLMLILSNLPAKSVLRFRIACKLWNSITRGSDFANLQLRNGSDKDSNVVMILNNRLSQSRFALYRLKGSRLSLNFLLGGIRESDYVTAISNSYNGLVCVFTRVDTVLVNPCTSDFIVLPKACSGGRASVAVGGLGFDVSTGKYKVVRLVTDTRKATLDCMIFTIGSRSWRKLEDTPIIPSDYTCVFVDGSFFWAGYQESVLALDIQREVFREIPFPEGKFMSRQVNIGELAGHLHLADKEWFQAEMKLYVLQALNEGPSWNLIYTVDLRTMNGWVPIYMGRPLALWNGKIVLANDNRGLDYFDIESKRFTERYCWNLERPCRPVVHVESLISPHAIQQSSSNEVYDADNSYVLLGGAMVSSDKEGMEVDEEEELKSKKGSSSNEESDSEEESESNKVSWVKMQVVDGVRLSYSGNEDGSLYDLINNCCIGTWSDGLQGKTYLINGHSVPELELLIGPKAWWSSPRESCSQQLQAAVQRAKE